MLTLLVFDESTYEKVNITIINYFWMFSLITTFFYSSTQYASKTIKLTIQYIF